MIELDFLEKRQLIMLDQHPLVSLYLKGEREGLLAFDSKPGIVSFNHIKYPIHRFKAAVSKQKQDLLFKLNPTRFLAMECCSFLLVPLEYKNMQAREAVMLSPGVLSPKCVIPQFKGLSQLKASQSFSKALAVLVNWSEEQIEATLQQFVDAML